MQETPLTRAVDKVVALKMGAIDRFIRENVDVLTRVGSPEEVIGKPYATWTPQDKQVLGQIYGPGKDSPLEKLIFNREYEYLKKLEQGVK
jgi:hypothetical protein